MIERQQAEYVEVDIPTLAAKLRCELVIGDAKTILLDLDTDEAKQTYHANLPVFKQQYVVESVERWPSKGGHGEHVVLHLTEPIDDTPTRLLLQASLGSDPKRELLSLYRVKHNHPTPSVLFKPKPKTATAAAKTTLDANDDDDEAVLDNIFGIQRT